MTKRRILGVFTVMLTAALLLSACTSQPPVGAANEGQSKNTVTVSGSGQVNARPDTAVVTLGVQIEAEEAEVALSQNSIKMAALIAALKEAGVADEDVQTRAIQLWPRYEEAEPRGGRELVGYTASNTVEVRVRDLDSLGQLLDAAVKAGGNRVEGIRFEIADPAGLLDEAREAAWEDARHKAAQLAEMANAELGEVSMIEESSYSPGPVGTGAAREAAGEVPVMPGSQMVEVNLRVTWQLTGQLVWDLE